MKTIVKSACSALGIRVSRETKAACVLGLIRRLRPLDCGIDMIRIGGPQDGGYLVPNDLEGIEYCFSPGVGGISDFEEQLAQMHIKSFLADYSVDAPLVGRADFTFDKKFLGVFDREEYFTLETWKEKYLKDYAGDLLLQMDIEGCEYEVILNIPDRLLNQFRILVIEFHNLDRLFDPFVFNLYNSCFEKLLQYFNVVHIHPNNTEGSVIRGTINVPKLMEFTFINKRRVTPIRLQVEFPHRLDADCFPATSLVLPKIWYSGT